MNNKVIRLVTKNSEKIAIANVALNDSTIQLEIIPMSCLEIQSKDASEIAIFSVKDAFDAIKQPVVKIDTGFYIEALNGFPGPYTSYVEETLDATDILQLMKGKSNRRAYYKEVMAYYDGTHEPAVFEAYTYGTISEELSGNQGWNFDRFFIIDGEQDTIANFCELERAKKYSFSHWENLKKYLS